MSVLKDKRLPSKAEYVNTANQIYIETIRFLSRISARYSRLIAGAPAKLAAELVEQTEKANKIFPSDEQRKQLRKAHLLEAQAVLSALDVSLLHCYLVMMKNPQGCFTNSKGDTLPESKAAERLDAMSQSLGELIAHEEELLRGILTSDRKR